MKCLLGLVAILPFLANATTATVSTPQTIVQSILNLKKAGVNTSSIMNELTESTKAEMLDILPLEIQNSDNLEIIDLRSLENDLKKSIHDTGGF